MARKKTAAELAADIKRIEERLAKLKQQEQRQTKAEEAYKNAEVLRVIKEYWAAMPASSRPEWELMPDYIRAVLKQRTKEAQSALPHEE